ncbi:N-formylglutamate amidohydrolase [Aeromicrobium wangtongii]|uniref:N-formylglutamate amidohydrolase n=1 Tax=Aeromicrobium wangtongii TaxID=2969247 RepID=A0ABY5M5Y8_9ACTN|nr:N-formylglutamate amidohydrolase [Aeromicrobium wangtongii]UUP12355.1 N-formylglutamate amidohydrolase [Aeromicrobium wangtongii]
MTVRERAHRVIPGDAESHVIIHVPHSSRVIPREVRSHIFLDDAALGRELDAVTDAFTDVIAEHAAARASVRPWLFINDFSRLVVDPVGAGVVHTRTSDDFLLREVSDDEISGLVVRHLAPYAAAFTELVTQRVEATGEATIIDLHSYPLHPPSYGRHGDGPRAEVRFGTDDFYTPHWLVANAQKAFGHFEVDLHSFAGCYVPLKQYRSEDRVSALMIELRRDLYMDETFGLVAPALEPIIFALAGLLDTVEPDDGSWTTNNRSAGPNNDLAQEKM